MGGLLGLGKLLDPAMIGTMAKNIAAGVPKQPGGLTGFFQNPLVLQLLAAGGLDISQGTGGKNTLAALMQNISSQNFMGPNGIFSKIIGGGMPGVSAKMTDKGVTIDMARETPIGQPGPNPGQTGIAPLSPGGADVNAGQGGTPLTSQNGLGGLRDYLNPFSGSQLNFDPSNLAGVDPQLFMQAIGAKLQGEGLASQRLSDIADIIYKRNLAEYNSRMAGVAEANVPINKMDAETAQFDAYRKWMEMVTEDKRTELQKNYDAAKKEGFSGPIWEFKAYDETGDWANYQQMKKEGSFKGNFKQYMDKYANKGTTINLSPFEQTRQRGLADIQTEVISGDFSSTIESKLSKLDTLWGEFTPEVKEFGAKYGLDNTKATTLFYQKKVLDEMDKEVRQAFARDVSGEAHRVERKADGWYVDGKLTVRNPYARR